MVILMVLGFMLAWTPYAVVAFWIFTNKGADFTATLMAVPAFFSKSSSLYNPIIYVLMNKQVRCPVSRRLSPSPWLTSTPGVTAGTLLLPIRDGISAWGEQQAPGLRGDSQYGSTSLLIPGAIVLHFSPLFSSVIA